MHDLVRNSSLPRHEARRLAAIAGETDDPEATFRSLEAERLDGAPLQYLEGTAVFGPLELTVDERVLIPRPETEQLWELSQRLVPFPGVVVDLCTGSGAVALAWKRSVPTARVLGTDLSAGALDVAAANGNALGLVIEWYQGDLFAALPGDIRGEIDLITANPPYVGESEWPHLPADVRREPRSALVAGPSGLEVLERIARDAGDWLAPGGWVICEMGETQGGACAGLFADHLDRVEIAADLSGRPRFVIGRRT